MVAFKQVPVNVHGDLNTTMTELLLDIFRISPALDEQAGIGMPEIVKPHPPELCFC